MILLRIFCEETTKQPLQGLHFDLSFSRTFRKRQLVNLTIITVTPYTITHWGVAGSVATVPHSKTISAVL